MACGDLLGLLAVAVDVGRIPNRHIPNRDQQEAHAAPLVVWNGIDRVVCVVSFTSTMGADGSFPGNAGFRPNRGPTQFFAGG